MKINCFFKRALTTKDFVEVVEKPRKMVFDLEINPFCITGKSSHQLLSNWLHFPSWTSYVCGPFSVLSEALYELSPLFRLSKPFHLSTCWQSLYFRQQYFLRFCLLASFWLSKPLFSFQHLWKHCASGIRITTNLEKIGKPWNTVNFKKSRKNYFSLTLICNFIDLPDSNSVQKWLNFNYILFSLCKIVLVAVNYYSNVLFRKSNWKIIENILFHGAFVAESGKTHENNPTFLYQC